MSTQIRSRALATLAACVALPVLAEEAPTVAFDWFRYEGRDPQFAAPPDQGHYQNPVLAGFYPDPSVVRVDEDYYLVNSSFAYFPGLPIFHSTDLVHWKKIGHALQRREQLTFENGQGISRGLFAPTIRHHEETFYIINTDVDGIGNFIVTATDPAGPWSDPVALPEIDGIDPDLFFDDDGRVWIAHNGPPAGQEKYSGHRAIWLWEFDLANMQLMQNSARIVVDGGVDISQQPIWIEGPHLYKANGWYYLICAEGGTEEGHSQVVFRARSLDEPFVPWKRNPILTQRDLGPTRPNPVTSTGHADLVQTPAGDWWAVFLGVRPYVDSHFNTGRETFLLPVTWEDDWPRILEPKTPLPLQPQSPDLPAAAERPPPQSGNFVWRDDFDGPELNLEWMRVYTSPSPWWKLDGKNGLVRLEALPFALNCRSARTAALRGRFFADGETAPAPSPVLARESRCDQQQPAFLARRQQHRAFDASTRLELPRSEATAAGLAAYQSSDFHYFLGVRAQGDVHEVFLEQVRNGVATEITRALLGKGLSHVLLGVEQEGARLGFYFQTGDEREWVQRDADATLLSTKVAGGFVGATVGIHARQAQYRE